MKMIMQQEENLVHIHHQYIVSVCEKINSLWKTNITNQEVKLSIQIQLLMPISDLDSGVTNTPQWSPYRSCCSNDNFREWALITQFSFSLRLNAGVATLRFYIAVYISKAVLFQASSGIVTRRTAWTAMKVSRRLITFTTCNRPRLSKTNTFGKHVVLVTIMTFSSKEIFNSFFFTNANELLLIFYCIHLFNKELSQNISYSLYTYDRINVIYTKLTIKFLKQRSKEQQYVNEICIRRYHLMNSMWL